LLSEEDSLPFQILLTSNSAADIANIKEALGHYHAFVSASGDEAMEILKADPKINLLILDLKASGAFRLLEALKTDDCLKKLRTVILTDSEDPESESKGLQLGAIDFLRRPISPEALKARIKVHLSLLRAEKALEEESFLLLDRSKTVFLHHLPGLAYRCDFDRNWTMRYVSEGCYNLTGYRPESLLFNRDISYNDIIAPEYRDFLWNRWHEVVKTKEPFRHEYEIITASGQRRWVIEMGQPIFNENGEVEALEGIVLDIAARKAAEIALKHSLEHDRWTGLYNRDYLESVFADDLRRNGKGRRAFVGINLSTVEILTVQYGFQYTQGLISKTAETLSNYYNSKRILFYPNQNRFAFYFTDYRDKEELLDFAKVIEEALERLFRMERIGGGIGILEFDLATESNLNTLLHRLLVASEKAIKMYEKEIGICFYDEELEAAVNREREITNALHRIADGDESCDRLFLEYQPILNLEDDRICCFETLARLQTEKLGLVSPLEFIPLAEKTKLIVPLGEKIIEESFRFQRKLREQGFKDVSIAVNISLIQLLSPDFTERLFALMRETGTDPAKVVIEITESVFSENFEAVNSIIEKLREAGMHIAIDDFGTGYSSLARERELQVDCIKLAKAFIDKLLTLDWSKAITGDIISMAHKLGHCIVAEGVEHEIQLQYLRKHHCDRVQGFLISKPLDETAAIELLYKYKKKSS